MAEGYPAVVLLAQEQAEAAGHAMNNSSGKSTSLVRLNSLDGLLHVPAAKCFSMTNAVILSEI